MADRIVILSSGRVVADGSPRQLATDAGTGTGGISFGAPAGLDTAPLADALGEGVTVREPTPGRYRIEGASGPARPRRWPPGWPSGTSRSPTW